MRISDWSSDVCSSDLATALHADEAVLDEVEAADAVVAAQLVEAGEQRGRRQRLAVDPHGIAVLEVEGDDRPPVGRLLGRDAARDDVLLDRKSKRLNSSY